MTKSQRIQLLYLLGAALWGCLIFYLSSLPDLKSALPSWQDFILRKIAHISVFLILTYFLLSSLVKYTRFFIYFVIAAAILYAWLDEFHQAYVPFRVGSARDILIDSFGVLLGVWIYRYLPPDKIINKLKK